MRRNLPEDIQPEDIQPEDRFAALPEETIVEIAILEPIENITKLCQTSVRFNDSICNNNNFWLRKLIHDFGKADVNLSNFSKSVNVLSWKKAYMECGRIYASGSNEYGQLGIDNILTTSIPSIVPNVRSTFFACGGFHTVVIDINREVWVFGANGYGQLGLGHTETVTIPTPLFIDGQRIKARHVVCGANNTMLIDMDRNLWGFGSNDFGQLGLGDNVHRYIPQKVSGNIGSVACGDYHTIIINMAAEVWSCGRNDHGQLGLGLGPNEIIFTPTPIFVPTNTGKLTNLHAGYADCGAFHTTLLGFQGELIVFGSNRYGQLGIGGFLDINIPAISLKEQFKGVVCGHSHTIVKADNGKIYGCGDNQYGQLGLGNLLNTNKFYLINIEDDIERLSCGRNHTILTSSVGDVYVFGANNYGQLGLGDNNNRRTPVKILNRKYTSAFGGGDHTIFSIPISQVAKEHHLISYTVAERKLNGGEFLGFSIDPNFQFIPHKSRNVIATFRGRGVKDIYHVELRYDSDINQILPPV